jgi:hypothetical protein
LYDEVLVANECGKNVREALGKLIGEDRAKNIGDDLVKTWLEGVEQLAEMYDKGQLPKADFNARLTSELETFRLSAEIRATLKAKDAIVTDTILNHVNQPAFKDKPWEAFRSLITKTYVMGKNAKVSAEIKAKERGILYTRTLDNKLQQKKLKGVFMSGVLDEEIHMAVHQIDTGVKIEGQKISQQAMDIAYAIKSTNDLMFKDMKQVGLPVLYKKSRVTMQTHDATKLINMGKEAWVNKVLELKPSTAFLGKNAATPEGLRLTVEGIYDDIILGRHASIDETGKTKMNAGDVSDQHVGSSKLGKRSLVFGPKETYLYNKEFGVYDTVAQTLASDVQKTALKTTLFEMFGDRPKDNINRAIQKKIADLKQEGDFKAAEKLTSAVPNINANLGRVARTTNIPASKRWAIAENIIAGAEVLSKLGNVGVRSLANIANMISGIKNATGQNYLEVLGQSVFDSIKQVPGGFKKTYFTEAADILDQMNKSMAQEISGDGVAGFMTRMANLTQKVNGMDFINNVFSEVASSRIGTQWGEALSKTTNFKELNPNIRSGMMQAGITEADFGILKLSLHELSNGKKFMDPMGLSASTPEVRQAIKAVMAQKGLKTTPEKYLQDLQLKHASYLGQIKNMVTTTAGAREKAALMGDLQTGTPLGFAASVVTRFKSFSAQAYLTTREMLNSKVDTSALDAGISKSTGENAYKNTAQFVVTSMAIAYLADSFLRLANGKDVRDPKDPGTILDALAKSSAGGLYLDIFNGEWDRYSFAEALAGPTVGATSRLASAVTNVTQGEGANAAMDVTKLARSYMPFNQAILVKNAYDHVQNRVIKEALFPGSNLRYDARVRQEELKRKFLEGGER